jgi:GTP-binding protein
LIPGEASEIPVRILQQAEVAIERASLIFFIVDGRTGVTVADQELSRLLRRTQKTIFLVVNKIDSA